MREDLERKLTEDGESFMEKVMLRYWVESLVRYIRWYEEACCDFSLTWEQLAMHLLRLSLLLPKIISEEQGAFIKGRNISKNISLAYELMLDLDRKVLGYNVIIKLDMLKAYDRLGWDFISYGERGNVWFVGQRLEVSDKAEPKSLRVCLLLQKSASTRSDSLTLVQWIRWLRSSSLKNGTAVVRRQARSDLGRSTLESLSTTTNATARPPAVRFPTGRRFLFPRINEEGRSRLILPNNRKRSTMPGGGDGKRNCSEERNWGSQCFSTPNEMRQPRDALLLTPQGSETELNLSLG
ncbi:hypothetical protein NE237_005368 [Protea cynaroides]|uniref:Reverse transcriptase domain-containing protein n=1 Tax=Protea cynaroides TaxID=273540 RepID=A0A9Q0QUK0_9MAGN|nr:hypothetical protein NE237_005368 [Protea cynaroides]